MTIDDYYITLENLARDVANVKVATHDYLEDCLSNADQNIIDIIEFRKELIDSSDLERARPYLIIGNFTQLPLPDRIACFLITLEIGTLRSKLSWEKRCELYIMEQALFQSEPGLFDQIRKKENGAKDYELINNNAVTQISDSEIVRLTNNYAYIDCGINPLYHWAKNNFRGSPLYVRLNPHQVFDSIPNRMMFESILMPANPNWWKKLTIHNRGKEGASYKLDDCLPEEDDKQYWDFHIKKILRLEIIAKRNNNGNLSMMIEEITSIKNDGLRFGRMIHLDTDSPIGTNFNDAKLNHLDLAINVYEGTAAATRGNENLADGNKTVDATFRTHLLRIENIEFKALFGFAICFFTSQILVNQWLQDQFQIEPSQ